MVTPADLAILGALPLEDLERIHYAETCRRDLPQFLRDSWHVHHEGTPLIWNWHLDAICDHLRACTTGDITRLIINVPPRTLKSHTVSVAWPAWWWARDPRVQFIVGSNDKDVVYRDADHHRELCSSKWYLRTFDPDWSFRDLEGRKQDAKGNFRNTAGGHRISKPMGAKGQGNDADVVIIDDPLDSEDAYNDKAALAQHVVQFKQRFSTRLNDQATGVIVVIMQRLHQLDLSGVLLEEGGWEHLLLPAEFEANRRTFTILGDYDLRKEEGELLFPERLPKEFLDKQRTTGIGPRGHAGQYQQRPAPAQGAIIEKAWLAGQYWTPGSLPSEFDYVFSSWDMAYKKTTDSDFVVGQVWGVLDGHYYLLDQVRRRMNVDDMVEAVREVAVEYPDAIAHVIEEKAAGRDVFETVQREIDGVETYDPQDQSKEQRLAATVTLWSNKRVWLPHPYHCSTIERDYSWVKDYYIRELTTFPSVAHDDQVDATSQALLWARKRGSGQLEVAVLGGK